jgi:hypothetical protein
MQRIVIDSLPPNVKITGDAQGKIVIVFFCVLLFSESIIVHRVLDPDPHGSALI